jgi:nuclease YhcG-like protein
VIWKLRSSHDWRHFSLSWETISPSLGASGACGSMTSGTGVDLVFFHRLLRCLVVIDLKLGKFTHSDAGQMHLYLNYAREHWTRPGENPPVGLIPDRDPS